MSGMDPAPERRRTKRVSVGGVPVGGGSPVTVQTMTKCDTRDRAATLVQIMSVQAAGADIVRCAVPDEDAASALCSILPQATIPVVADIHFDYRLALTVVRGGISCLRLNPGNIGSRARVEEVTAAARDRGIPIRIGVNAGSLEKHLLQKYGWPTAEAMVESALGHINILEKLGFFDIKVSLKASDVRRTVEAYRLFSSRSEYPLHLGITEAGGVFTGTVKSSIGLGILLEEGIGDTIRVSLTGPPEEEVRVGKEILKALGIRSSGPVIVSCPTCGRAEVALADMLSEIEKRLEKMPFPHKIAVMGCAVNGPGECAEADLGLAGGRSSAVIYKRGKVLKKVDADKVVDEFVREAFEMAEAEKIKKGGA